MTLEQLKEEGCPFCDESKIKSEILGFDDVIVFTPLNPVCEGHTLVVPRQHVTDFTDNPEVTALVIEHASRIAQMRGGDYNLITSKGRSATQSVFHLHVHLIPRKAEDGLLLPWTGKETLHHQLQKAREEERERIMVYIDRLPVYYRSKFSRDCSRQETEDEMSTEMFEREQVLQALTPTISSDKE